MSARGEKRGGGGMRGLGRRLVLLAAAGLTALALADFLFWRLATDGLERGFRAWVAEAAGEGLAVRAGAIRRSGFPAAARLEIEGLAVAPADQTAGMAASLPRLALEIRPEAPRTLLLRPAGPVALNALGTSLLLEAGFALITHRLDHNAPYVLEAKGLAMRSTPAAAPLLRLRRLTLTLLPRPGDPPSLSLEAAGEGLLLPPELTGGTGGEIARLAGEAALTPRPAFDFTDPGAGLRAFRAAHGQAAFRLRLEAGGGAKGETTKEGEVREGAAAAVEGGFHLDARLLPEGEGRVRLTDPDAVIEAFVRAGLIGEAGGRTLHALAALLVRRPPAGPPELELPLSASGGVLSVGGIPLLPFAP